ncbi:MAG: hypothetical protein ACTHNE_06090 [Dyella sp.]
MSRQAVAPASGRSFRAVTPNLRTHADMRPNKDLAGMRTAPSLLAFRAIGARPAPSP